MTPENSNSASRLYVPKTVSADVFAYQPLYRALYENLLKSGEIVEVDC